MRILSILLLVFLTGCGYHLPESSETWIGGEDRILYVDLFENQTVEPYVENFITDALVAEFSRSRLVELTESPELADLKLKGEVVKFKSSAISYSSTDEITDYRASMKVAVWLQRSENNEKLWQKTLSQSEDYRAAVNKNDQLEGERLAAREVAKRLAEDIYAQLLNNF